MVVSERLNADGLPPSFQLNQADGEFLLEPLLFIRGDDINLSFLLVTDVHHMSQPPGHGFCLNIE
jgi:hypothetical protein